MTDLLSQDEIEKLLLTISGDEMSPEKVVDKVFKLKSIKERKKKCVDYFSKLKESLEECEKSCTNLQRENDELKKAVLELARQLGNR